MIHLEPKTARDLIHKAIIDNASLPLPVVDIELIINQAITTMLHNSTQPFGGY